MLSLIFKDLKAFGHIILAQLILIIFMMSFGIFFDHNGNLTVMVIIIYPMSLPMVLLLNDTKHEPWLLSMPISRYVYVVSKYLGGLIFAYGLIFIGLLYSALANTLINAIPFAQLFSLAGSIILIFPVVISVSLTYPVYFKYTKAKASMVMILIFSIVLIGLILALVYFEETMAENYAYSKADILPYIMDRITQYITTIGPKFFIIQVAILVSAALLLSTAISLIIIKRKDIGGVS